MPRPSAQATAESVTFSLLSILAYALPVGLLKLFVGVRPQTTPLTRGFHACRLCFGGKVWGPGVIQRDL